MSTFRLLESRLSGLPIHIYDGDMGEPNRVSNREKRKLAFRARHRLHSIDRDAANLKQNQCVAPLSSYPIIPNKHCGAWYLSSPAQDGVIAAHFKSTDGHVGTYNFSLKRLNLPLVQLLSVKGGCVLVDSSTRKTLPDSFSRTIPIWCCVLNRIALRYRKEMNLREELNDDWDDGLHTPDSLVSPEEHARIVALIGERVEMLWRSRAIVDPRGLVETLTKPLRAVWIANNDLSECSSHQFGKYFTLVCCNPSVQSLIEWIGDDAAGYYYSPGAADDENSWARNLTPELFWSNREQLLDPRLTDDQVDSMIDSTVQQNIQYPDDTAKRSSDKIGNLHLWLGSRRAGRPPECFTEFDCILNVTENEYEEMRDCVINQRCDQRKCHYLQLPVLEGKRDKTELERWLPVALIFIANHMREGRKILVHCAQGKDRSVGIVLAFVCIFCRLEFPLQLLRNDCLDGIEEMIQDHEEDDDADSDGMYLLSGLRGATVRRLLREDGREVFMQAIHRHLSLPTEPLATKESLRVAHHLVSQDREQAEPTRSTFQKLNRFFMSSTLYRKRDPGVI